MAETKALATVSEAVVAQVNALLPDANAGNPGALAELRSALDAHPELWGEVGNVARQAELALVRAVAGHNGVAKEAIIRRLDTLRQELARPAPTPLELLVVDRVVVGWLAVAVAEGAYHQSLERGIHHADDEFHQRRVERAQRRYLAAIKALATVRRLGVPALQVNIGEKQINVAR